MRANMLRVMQEVHLALATHSMVTSEVPLTTLVFLGAMIMVGAIGSAGPPTSEDTHTDTNGAREDVLFCNRQKRCTQTNFQM